MVRVGFGSDSHRFDPASEKPLILGGVKVSDGDGLEANSDGDVILHALFNALSQACGGDSIGVYADPMLARGITDSCTYLKVSLDMVADRGYRVCNIGIMIEAKRPRLTLETVGRMRARIAGLAGIAPDDVGITFTSGEGLTDFGKGRGILAQAVVSLVPL